MTDEWLQHCINEARKTAASVGSMHALWDLIFDAEAILKGEQSLLPREIVEREFLRMQLCKEFHARGEKWIPDI